MSILLLILSYFLVAYAGYWIGRAKGFQEGRESWADVIREKNRLIESLRDDVSLRNKILRTLDRDDYIRQLEARYMDMANGEKVPSKPIELRGVNYTVQVEENKI